MGGGSFINRRSCQFTTMWLYLIYNRVVIFVRQEFGDAQQTGKSQGGGSRHGGATA